MRYLDLGILDDTWMNNSNPLRIPPNVQLSHEIDLRDGVKTQSCHSGWDEVFKNEA